MFGGLNAAAIVLFIVCFTLFPVLALKPTKFAIMYVLPAHSPRRALPLFYSASCLTTSYTVG